jgi:transcription-repair coupling factor (superfamily II helicase)
MDGGKSMKRLTQELCSIPEVAELLASVENGLCPAAMTGLGQVHRAQICAAARHKTQRPILALCSDEGEAARMASDLQNLTGEVPVVLPGR